MGFRGTHRVRRAWREPFVVLPPAGPLRRYAFITLVDSVGSGLFITISVLFFTRVIEFSITQVALGMSMAGFAALLGAIPLGSLGDRIGHRRVWILLTLVHAAAFAAYPLVTGYPAFVVLVAVVALADVGISPVRGAYLSLMAGPEVRVKARAYNQAVYNAGFALGAAGAGIALQFDSIAGYVALVLANSVSYLVAALVLLTLPAVAVQARKERTRVGAVLRDRPYVVVSVLNGLLMTYAAVLLVAIPLWIVNRTQAPAWSVGAVMILNTVLVVLLQVRASKGADTVPGAAIVIRRAGFAMLLACLILAVSGMLPTVPALLTVVLGVTMLTVAELFHSAGSWGVSFGLAPEDRQGEYLGAFAMGGRIYDAVGPALVTGLALGLGAPGWVALGVLFLGLAFALAKASTWAQSRLTASSVTEAEVP